MVKKLLKRVLQNIDDFWEFLNTPINNKKISKAQLQIKELINVMSFIMTTFIIMVITVTGQKIENLNGTGFIMVGFVYIFIIWAIVVLHTKKAHKHHSLLNPAKNIQPLNE